MFDITKLAASETSFCHFKGADDEPLYADKAKKEPVGVVLYGPSSQQAIAIDADISNRNIARMFKSKNKQSVTAESIRAEQIERLVARTKEFTNFSYPPAGSATGAELFEAIYSDRSIGFVADQAAAHMGDWAHFLPSSATN